MSREVVIGSRESLLAVTQSEMVMDWIRDNHPEIETRLLTMKTTGDRILDRTLDKVGGKGLFVKELDKALRDKQSDLSVHSLKDMPMEVDEDLPLIAFSRREDPRDVLVLPEGATKIDFSKPIGCSSRRRMLQLSELYPQATFENIRGNVQTRLKKLDSGMYSATILAAAGLKRLGLEHRISRYFSPEEMIPAAGQGILAVQGRKGEDYTFLEAYDDAEGRACALAERAFVTALDGGCSSPIAAHAYVQKNQIFLMGLYYDEATGAWNKGALADAIDNPVRLGRELADKLKATVHDRTKPGCVYLVGAGPGDARLLTIKARELIETADVIVYDALVGDGVLSMIPEGTRTINAGKRSGNHIRAQYETNRILLEEAQAGRQVVRLKGGDPFMFGRGGEELELLSMNRIPYEVVPGITSPIAVPAYNGIPITHRDYTSSFHVITGHKREGEVFTCDFEALVRTGGTLVFLMGVSALEDICNGLINAGMDKDMPAAVLSQGTTAGQQSLVATLSTLVEAAARQGVPTPAIIVVGKVCALADRFGWYENLPLSGVKLVVTRPRDLVSQMAAKLRRLGAEVLELPAIATEAISDNRALEEAVAHLGDYQWLAFTSPSGVRIFFEQLQVFGKDIRALGQIKIASIGSGTSKALKAFGLYPDLVPEVYDGAHLGAALCQAAADGDAILIPRADIGNHEIIEELSKNPSLRITDVATYATRYVTSEVVDLKKLFSGNVRTMAVFTSASTVRGFAAACGELDYTKVEAACIGKQTAAEALKLGMTIHVADKATMDSLTDCIVKCVQQG